MNDFTWAKGQELNGDGTLKTPPPLITRDEWDGTGKKVRMTEAPSGANPNGRWKNVGGLENGRTWNPAPSDLTATDYKLV